jgi:hypothetical protein
LWLLRSYHARSVTASSTRDYLDATLVENEAAQLLAAFDAMGSEASEKTERIPALIAEYLVRSMIIVLESFMVSLLLLFCACEFINSTGCGLLTKRHSNPREGICETLLSSPPCAASAFPIARFRFRRCLKAECTNCGRSEYAEADLPLAR